MLEKIISDYFGSLLVKCGNNIHSIDEIVKKEAANRECRDFMVACALVYNNDPGKYQKVSTSFQPAKYFADLLNHTSFDLDSETLNSFLDDEKVRKAVSKKGEIEYNLYDSLNLLKSFYEKTHIRNSNSNI